MKQGKNRILCTSRIITATLILVLVAACGGNQVEESRSETFKQYETIVRWSQWDAAVDYLAPEYLAENPISRLDMDRLRLFRVTQYMPRQVAVAADGIASRNSLGSSIRW